jgi:hypothetical protein
MEVVALGEVGGVLMHDILQLQKAKENSSA